MYTNYLLICYSKTEQLKMIKITPQRRHQKIVRRMTVKNKLMVAITHRNEFT